MFSLLYDQFVREPNALTRAVEARKRAGLPVFDCIGCVAGGVGVDGVTSGAACGATRNGVCGAAGVMFPEDVLCAALDEGRARARVYTPDARGQYTARASVSDYYKRHGVTIDPDAIVMTPGTSQSYWYLFQALCDRDDEVLVPRPSYPLFAYIAQMCGVRLRAYDLRVCTNGSWEIDIESVRCAVGPSTRAIILISPHNPTGHVVSEDEMRSLAEICYAHTVPLIVDEVFSEFVYSRAPASAGARSSLPHRHPPSSIPLTIFLNGCSKMFALPGLKIGWMALYGNEVLVRRCMALLEMISDTFLATNEMAQFALPMLFDRSVAFCADYYARAKQRRDDLAPYCSYRIDGGLYGIRAIDGRRDGDGDDESYAIDLLERTGVLVHPGYFYDLSPRHIVFSLLGDCSLLKRVL